MKVDDNQGFLMVEVSIATIFISVALLAVMTFLLQCYASNRQAEGNINAPYLAQHKMEQIKAGLAYDSGSESSTINGVRYIVQWNKALEQTNSFSSLYKTTVNVNWQEQEGNNQLSFSTYLIDGIAQSPQW